MEGKRAACVWHRRSGKDSSSVNLTAVASHQRVGTYWHMLPTLNQGRKVIWDSIDRSGRRIIDQAFPEPLRDGINNTEMTIRFKNGSMWQVVGSDNYNSLVGANPVGVVFSEYSVADPAAWDYIRPILLENGGWAVFIYTARGRNHGYHLKNMAFKNPNWFGEILTVDETGVLTPEDIQEERNSGMAEEMIQQEYYCSFDAGLVGAYYSKQMEDAWKEKRITEVPYNPSFPVYTAWDLGVNDATAIWFLQKWGSKIMAIDYIEESDQSLKHFIKKIKEKPYVYGGHIGPHDLKVREFGSGAQRFERAQELGLDFDIAPNIPLLDGIDSVRAMLPRMYFDAEKCERGVSALENYQKRWDDKLKTYGRQPLHNWASNGADALRMYSVAQEVISDGWTGEYADWDNVIQPDTKWVI